MTILKVENCWNDIVCSIWIMVSDILNSVQISSFIGVCTDTYVFYPARFGKIDLWIINLISVNRYLAIQVM